MAYTDRENGAEIRRLLIDLRVCARPVPQAAIDACKAALQAPEPGPVIYVQIAL